MNAPRFFWRLIHVGPRIAYALGLGRFLGHFVLLLTTIGRKSGRPRVTPLAYDELGGTYFVASARGACADWLRNIRANPNVHVRVGGHRFRGSAENVTHPMRIADYLQRQLERNPRLFGAILRSEGLPSRPTRQDLERLAPKRPMVAIRPKQSS